MTVLWESKIVDVVERLFLIKETEHLGVRSRLILLMDLMLRGLKT